MSRNQELEAKMKSSSSAATSKEGGATAPTERESDEFKEASPRKSST